MFFGQLDQFFLMNVIAIQVFSYHYDMYGSSDMFMIVQ